MKNTLSSDALLSGLNWRYATKKFDAHRKLSPELVKALEDALVLTASGYGLQPWKFVFVNDPALREKLTEAAYGQTQVKTASHLVVFATKTSIGEKDVEAYLKRIAAVRGIPEAALSGFRDMLMNSIVKGMTQEQQRAWAARQAYIALGNLLTSAALLGIDAGPMEGFDPKRFDEILGLGAKGLSASVICVLGYRDESDPYASLAKVRFPKEETIMKL